MAKTPFVVTERLTKANARRGLSSDSERKESRDKLILEWIETLPNDQKILLEKHAKELVNAIRQKALKKTIQLMANPNVPHPPMPTIMGVETAKIFLIMIALNEDVVFSNDSKKA